MAKTKAELLDEAKKLGIEVDAKTTVAEIKAIVDDAANKKVETPTEVETQAENADTEQPQTAKAGKRSTKSLKEAAEKQAKEERKADGDEAAEEIGRQVDRHAGPHFKRVNRSLAERACAYLRLSYVNQTS